MTKDILAHGVVRELIEHIEAVCNPKDGSYVLYAPAGVEHISEDMEAAIILEPKWWEEDDPLPEFALEHNLEPACEITLAQDVIVSAKRQKPEVTNSELIAALDYFLEHDAFLDFET